MSTIDTIKAARASAPAPSRFRRLVAGLLVRFLWAADRQRTRATLRDLSDAQLRDIGLTRREAVRESHRWFWE